jgi:hypothetical protein
MPTNIRRHNFRMLSYVAFGLIASSVLAIGLTIRGLRTDAIQETNANIGNIATVLSEQLARSIQSVDIVLTDVRERVEKQAPSAQEELDQQTRGRDLHEFLRDRLSRLSQADFIAIIKTATDTSQTQRSIGSRQRSTSPIATISSTLSGKMTTGFISAPFWRIALPARRQSL